MDMMNQTSFRDALHPIEPKKLMFFGNLFIVMFFTSLILNSIVLYALIKRKNFSKSINLCSIVIKILNILSTILCFPFIIAGIYMQKYIFHFKLNLN